MTMRIFLILGLLSFGVILSFGAGTSSVPPVIYEDPAGTFNVPGDLDVSGVVYGTVVGGTTVQTETPIAGDGSSGDKVRFSTAIAQFHPSSSTWLYTMRVVNKTDFGSKTDAQIRALQCPLLPCVVMSSESGRIFKATATHVAGGYWLDNRGMSPTN